MHKAFPLPVIEFPLSEEVPTASEESSHCQKKRDATAVKIALLLKSRSNRQSKSYDSYAKNMSDLNTMSLDDMYNHLKVYESEVQKKSEPNSKNMDFISSAKHSSGNEDVNIASGSTASINVSTASANIGIDEDDMEEMDIKWNMALLSMRADRNAGLPEAKTKEGETTTDKENHALVADEQAPTEFALMAKTSAESEVFDNSLCSKACKKNTDSLKNDMYNHLKVYESEVQKKSEPNSQNMDFISSAKHSSGNEDVNIASGSTASINVSTASANIENSNNEDGNTLCVTTATTAFPTALGNVATTGAASDETSKKKGKTVTLTTDDMQKRKNDVKARTTLLLSLFDEHQLRFREMKKLTLLVFLLLALMFPLLVLILEWLIDEDDMKEMDIKWNIALLSMRADRFWKKTRKKISIKGIDVAGFDKSKVECFNCHKTGHFARECRAPKSQDRERRDNYRQRSKVKEQAPKALMANDGVGWDWSYMANDDENHALVADEEAPSEFDLMTETSSCLRRKKGELETKLTSFQTASKDLDNLLESQRLDKNKKGLRYSAVPPPSAQIYSPLKKDMSWTGLPEFKDDTGSSQNNIDDKGYWDSGCSRHMKGNISYLFDYEPFDGGYVSFGQGGCNITGKGTIKTGKLKFENVYFVKDLKYNLFSVSQICDNKNSVLFTNSECIVLGRDFKLLDDANVYNIVFH
nr:ribonuclease H-like domain-containing protein [Tanacetum cinerariifolium]